MPSKNPPHPPFIKRAHKEIRLRFAPSPTGFLHIGSLRTVLFDWLAAKSLGGPSVDSGQGQLILRIEDTDQKREVEGAIQNLIEILNWLGIKFNEGPHIPPLLAKERVGVRSGFGPYVQSQRLDIYKKYAGQLLAEGKVYRCFCSAERLQKMREEQQVAKLPPRYDRLCCNLNEKEVEKRAKSGEPFVIRQKMPLKGEIIVHDELRGDIKFNAGDLEDHVLIKSNGVPTYQFASVVDDHLMEISHILRGDEWLSSFPKNILLYRDFGWTPPKFIHLPLVLDKKGGKLSKRTGDVAVEDYREKGYLPEALINFCALLGWHPKEDNEIFSPEELVKKFKVEDMRTSPAIFDLEKLDYFNGYYIRQKAIEELTNLCIPYLVSAGLIEKITNYKLQITNKFQKLKFKNKLTGKEIDYNFLRSVVALEQERLKKLSDIGEATEFFFEDKLDYPAEMLVWKKMPLEETKKNLETIYKLLEKIQDDEWTKHSTKDVIMGHIEAVGGKAGDYLWPLRVALTGRRASPPPFEVAEILGKEGSLRRVREGIGKI
ncbi:glutamate--tRNA ligase [Candidatus Falkowbacteria bacterium]|nr:glutamate--tRNA ligase [Candidatus Falkowbacteria bacterium]